jgi:hypothetical protein
MRSTRPLEVRTADDGTGLGAFSEMTNPSSSSSVQGIDEVTGWSKSLCSGWLCLPAVKIPDCGHNVEKYNIG